MKMCGLQSTVCLGAVLVLGIVQSERTLAQSNSPFLFPNAAGLEWFADAKFGLFMTWGPVSQWGAEIGFPLVCTAFPCTVQAANHSRIQITSVQQLKEHRQAYADLAKTFNPVKFDPDAMATMAAAAGFKYLVFTAEHCDGFASFKTNISSYNIINTPYGKDVFGMLVTAFRAKGLRVGAYFCPSTWNSDDYWAPDALTAFGPVCRPNYSPPDDPERWQRYLKYLHGQLAEIAVQYKPDLVWIDCVDDPNTMDTEVEQLGHIFQEQNAEVLMQVRGSGVWEDYLEIRDNGVTQASSIMSLQMMPAGMRFEVPFTLGTSSWAFDPTASYKSPATVITNLLLLTCKGGNYLVNIGPGPDGLWADRGVAVLNEIASWMAINGEAIHGTVTQWPHEFTSRTAHIPQQTYYITASKNGTFLYAMLPVGTSQLANILPMHPRTLLDMENTPTMNFTINLAFVRAANLRKTISSVELLGKGKIDYFLNTTGLWSSFQSPVEVATLGSYWSDVNKDMAPCATRGCDIYTRDNYTFQRNESYCYAGGASSLVPLYLIFSRVHMDSALVVDPTKYSQQGYANIRTECYGSPSPGEGMVVLDLYWNEDLHDYWTLASKQSKSEAQQHGYKFVSTQAYVPSLSSPVTKSTLNYAYVFKITFDN